MVFFNKIIFKLQSVLNFMGEGINVPSGFGGIQRFSEEYESKIKLKPEHVVFFIVAVILFTVVLKVFFKI